MSVLLCPSIPVCLSVFSFRIRIFVSVLPCLSIPVRLSASVFLRLSFRVCLSVSVFLCLSIPVRLFLPVFPCLSFRVSIPVSLFPCLYFRVYLSLSIFLNLSFCVRLAVLPSGATEKLPLDVIVHSCLHVVANLPGLGDRHGRHHHLGLAHQHVPGWQFQVEQRVVPVTYVGVLATGESILRYQTQAGYH